MVLIPVNEVLLCIGLAIITAPILAFGCMYLEKRSNDKKLNRGKKNAK